MINVPNNVNLNETLFSQQIRDTLLYNKIKLDSVLNKTGTSERKQWLQLMVSLSLGLTKETILMTTSLWLPLKLTVEMKQPVFEKIRVLL